MSLFSQQGRRPMARNGRLALAAATLSCLALAAAVHTAAPGPNQSRQTRPGQAQPAVATRWMPDLTCTLEGFKDSAGTVPLPPGGTVLSSGPSVSAFIRMT